MVCNFALNFLEILYAPFLKRSTIFDQSNFKHMHGSITYTNMDHKSMGTELSDLFGFLHSCREEQGRHLLRKEEMLKVHVMLRAANLGNINFRSPVLVFQTTNLKKRLLGQK
ncbi:hypothetical protein ACFE04_001705 [Oxalis oulophora]